MYLLNKDLGTILCVTKNVGNGDMKMDETGSWFLVVSAWLRTQNANQ